jgi:RNA polymerase sigma factor (sigma-70 family)
LAGKVGPGSWALDWLEDVVQEAVLDTLRAYRSCLARSEAEFRSWLHTIARRRLLQLVRSETTACEARAQLAVEILLDQASPAFPSSQLRSKLKWLDEQLANLPPDHVTLLWAKSQSGATWKEVGATLGIPPTAAKRRYQRLIRRLRRAAVELTGVPS